MVTFRALLSHAVVEVFIGAVVAVHQPVAHLQDVNCAVVVERHEILLLRHQTPLVLVGTLVELVKAPVLQERCM